MDENKVRIADVAEELGLSTATVSNVLHGKTHKMSEATIKRVEQKLEETGYIPNMAGILIAQFLGAEDGREAWGSFTVSMVLCGMIAILFCAASFLAPAGILGLYTKDTLILGAGCGYLRLIAVTFLPMGVSTILIGKRLGKKEYDAAYEESGKIMKAGLLGAVVVSGVLMLFSGSYVSFYRVDTTVQELGQSLLFIFALYAPVKIENMILGGGILKSGGDTKTVMLIDIVGTWGMGIPLCFAGAYLLKWGIVGVYALLTSEEILRLAVSLVIFRKKKWMISLA